MRRLLSAVAAIFVLALSLPAAAHEVRPAYLGIEETSPNTYRVLWKQPTMGDVAIHLVPHLSNGWLERQPSDQYASAGFLIRTWIITARRPAAVDGLTVTIEGLEETITDVFVRVRLRNGQRLDTIVRPEKPSFRIALTNGNAMAMSAFLLLGIEHILTGPDHLLFVLGLLLLVRDRWMLLKTVSAFTVAHSLTLAAATFGAITLSTPLLNALIALSILFIAPEVVRAQNGGTSLTVRYPWIVAFAFGLLHGMGFASGLTSLGLEKAALLGALVFFNVGVEIGQLMFIALVLALLRAFRLMEIRWPRAFAMAPTYAIGILGATWTFQYSAILFGAS
ncbi:MAG TPA: HupE/UreJ family protein [Rhizomicrobium sp.]|nr:HupE/UreJ family protein [Rhizomicrobium sp.]